MSWTADEEKAKSKFLQLVKTWFPSARAVRGPRVYPCSHCGTPFLITNRPQEQELSEDVRVVFSTSARQAKVPFWFIAAPAGEGEFRILRIVPQDETVTCRSAEEVRDFLSHFLSQRLAAHVCPREPEH